LIPSLKLQLNRKRRLKIKSNRRAAGAKGCFGRYLSPVFLGTIPIFAKLAYAAGANVLTVVAFRTLFAAAVLWTAVLIFAPHFIRSSTPGILSSLLAGRRERHWLAVLLRQPQPHRRLGRPAC
jgi:hypothetical protein